MPIHDWTRVEAGIFHDFHLGWIAELRRALNSGILPPDHYALAEQITAGREPDVLTLHIYASKAKQLVIRHTSGHKVIAVLEIVSPGNKKSRQSLHAFVSKAEDFIRAGIHLLIVDLFPPSARDSEGIHKAIWDEIEATDFVLPKGRPLTLAAYTGGRIPEAFVQPVAIGNVLPDMPLYLTNEAYVLVPLEATYLSAWEAVPAFWREVLQSPVEGNVGQG